MASPAHRSGRKAVSIGRGNLRGVSAEKWVGEVVPVELKGGGVKYYRLDRMPHAMAKDVIRLLRYQYLFFLCIEA